VSETVRTYVLQHYPRTDPGRLRVIPRGIDPSAFPRAPLPDDAARQRVATAYPQLGGDGPLLLLPGRGTRLKGHADALALLAGLRRDGIDARLWMPGAREATRDAYMGELEAVAARLGIADALAMTPPTAAIAEAYAASDLVLQLSRKPESFGRTVIEALAVGRPVAGWAHGGVGELLQALQPRGAVAPFDGAALRDTVRDLLARSPVLAVTMPGMDAAREGNDAPGLLDAYSLQAMQDATLACYRELVDDPIANQHQAR
jgi:glycosyltransferase involved in cell wall biosynthesis